jgi:hypothetical protein
MPRIGSTISSGAVGEGVPLILLGSIPRDHPNGITEIVCARTGALQAAGTMMAA